MLEILVTILVQINLVVMLELARFIIRLLDKGVNIMQSGNIAQQDNYVPCHSNGRDDRRWFGYETEYSVFYACGIPFVTPSSGKTTSLSITFDAYDKYSGSATS